MNIWIALGLIAAGVISVLYLLHADEKMGPANFVYLNYYRLVDKWKRFKYNVTRWPLCRHRNIEQLEGGDIRCARWWCRKDMT